MTQIDDKTLYDSREMNYGNEFQNKSSSLNQGEDEEVADELNDNSMRFSKDSFPQQGDSIGQIK